ncbi:AfsR/SARP family transcriptional regulator [Sphaerisporangium dianthi]|uniref:BTAD domain-containing putative transcriptional regulator n=1 Tax=Sphaerisporangium dianthi TaxID=1436120 RepID=A0ABV9CK45_9ACTN
MQFRVLGPLEVLEDDKILTPSALKQRTVLALLVTHRNRVVPVSTLIEEIWGEAPPKSAVTTLQTYVYQVRKLFAAHAGRHADDILVTKPLGYVAAISPDDLDLTVFERSLARGQAALEAGRVEEASAALHTALALRRGDALTDVQRGALLSAQAARIDEAMLRALVLRVEADLRLGRHHELVSELRALVAENPLHEDLYAKLMVALYRSDRRSTALEVYHELRRSLNHELGLDPSPALQRLHQDVLSDAASLQPPVRARTWGGTLMQNVRLSQLPPDIGDFAGRAGDLAALGRLLEPRECAPRVVVLTGSAGIGKSVLARRAAHQARARFPDCQLYASLGADADPADVLAGFLRTAGVRHDLIPDSLQERQQLFRGWSADRSGLLLLDDAASAAQLRPLLPSGPQWAVVVTSRSVLPGLAGVDHLRLGLLSVGDAVEMLGNIVGRERVAKEPEAAASIVRMCGLWPLAIRTAGDRLVAAPHWSLDKLVVRLGDECHRLSVLRTEALDIRAQIASSYEQLDEVERSAVLTLAAAETSVFTLGTAASMLQGDRNVVDSTLDRLVNMQFLHTAAEHAAMDGDIRYQIPVLFRVFARELLETVGPLLGLF